MKQWYLGGKRTFGSCFLWGYIETFCALTTSHCCKCSVLDVFTSPVNLLRLTDFDVFRNNTPFINILLQELVFDLRPVHVGFTVYKLALRGVYLRLRLPVPTRNVASNALYSYSIGCTPGGVQCQLSTASWKFSLFPDLYSFFFEALQPLICQGVLKSRLHDHTDTPYSVGILWAKDQLDAKTSTWRRTTLTRGRPSCTPAAFEPAVPASERSQTNAWDGAATEVGSIHRTFFNFFRGKLVRAIELCRLSTASYIVTRRSTVMWGLLILIKKWRHVFY